MVLFHVSQTLQAFLLSNLRKVKKMFSFWLKTEFIAQLKSKCPQVTSPESVPAGPEDDLVRKCWGCKISKKWAEKTSVAWSSSLVYATAIQRHISR